MTECGEKIGTSILLCFSAFCGENRWHTFAHKLSLVLHTTYFCDTQIHEWCGIWSATDWATGEILDIPSE